MRPQLVFRLSSYVRGVSAHVALFQRRCFPSARTQRPWLRGRDVLEAAGFALVVGLLLKAVVVDFCYVPSASMVPTLLPGDYVVVSRIAYAVGLPEQLPLLALRLPAELRWWYRSPQRWDVVVAEFPDSAGVVSYYVKRVVGLPGDTLRFAGDTLVINRVAYWLPGMRERPRRIVVPYRGMVIPLSAASVPEWLPILQRDGASVVAAGDSVYIDGRPAEHYVVRHDHVFLMGDNYRASMDSRHWGPVPRRAIVGKAVMVYYSRAEDGRIRWNRIGTLLH